MATDTIPAPASTINAPIPIKGEVKPPVSGRLPPAAEAAEAFAVLLALAEAVAVEVALELDVELADAASGIPSPVARK
jgi:hypothetical protein